MKPAVRNFIAEYLGELVEGNVAVFAGAGLSAAAGYVDWRELIRPLSVELAVR
jgi:NAD-dependent SIR2 family protein deacetylase